MNVIIVDDTQINLTLMEALVKKIDGCRPFCFSDSAKGLRWCLDNEPDLIIVDYMMPAPDGIEFIRRVREVGRHQELPILMVTADHEKEIRYRALDTGATDFLTKPVDRIEFMSRVRNMLAIRKSHVLLEDRAALLAAEVGLATLQIQERERETVFRLARAAEYRDPDTGAHLQRMSNYSRLIAQRLGWSVSDQDMLLQSAPMHDLGKLGTPDHILLKPGRLTPDEFEIMKQHSAIGWEILKDSSSPVLTLGAEIALSHHEKFDGSGYPNAQSGEEISIAGRIVAVADVFDALTSERPYKQAWEIDRAFEFMEQGSGTHFDPACIAALMRAREDVLTIRARYQDTSGR